MKKIAKSLIIMMLCVTTLTACQDEDLGNTYVEGSDYQYMLEAYTNSLSQARGENGYFFLMYDYLYYLNNATQEMNVLCKKENEFSAAENTIAYCNGYLYFIEKGYAGSNIYILYRIKENETQKEVVYEFEGRVGEWCIHRDVLYFANYVKGVQKYYVDGVENKESIDKHYVKKMPLTGKDALKTEIIYESPNDYYMIDLNDIKAYGDYVYFQEWGYATKDRNIVTDENYLEYEYEHNMAYNIETKDMTEIKLSEEAGQVGITNITFWNDKLIIMPWDRTNKFEGESQDIYMADLDGSNVEVLFENRKERESCFSDGQYLYLSNPILVNFDKEETQYYEVYDNDLKLVDTFTMPLAGQYAAQIGSPDKMYFYMYNETRTGVKVYCFDKSTIGTYNGEALSYTTITEYPIVY